MALPLTRTQLDSQVNLASNTYNPRIKRIKFKTLFPASTGTPWGENYIVTLPGEQLTNSRYDNNYYYSIGGNYFIRISFPKLVSGLEGEGLYINLAKRNSSYTGGFEDIYGASQQSDLNAALTQFGTYLKTTFPPSPSSIGTQVATSYIKYLNFEVRGATTGTLAASSLFFRVKLEYQEQGVPGPGTGQNPSTITPR